MRKLIWLIILLLPFSRLHAQELNAAVSINYSQLGNNQESYFKTLEKSLREFINNTSWGTTKYSALEKIDCVFILSVSSVNNNVISGSLQVQSTRPVYNSTYSTPVLNFNDRDVTFSYIEFESLIFNPNSADSNLTNLIAFYANLLIGLDADTFALDQGNAYIQNALNIANTAQQSNFRGWKPSDGNNTRYALAADLASNTFSDYIKAIYMYHRLGLDYMAVDQQRAKQGLYESFLELDKVNSARGNSFLMRVFFDTKTNEIVNLYAGIPDANKKNVITLLNRLFPLNASKWSSL
ncbi:type IX secretion system protein PorD [Myroides sp. LJL119]